MIVCKALYGLKSSGAAFRALLSETLRDLGYVATKADPDVYIRPATRDDGFQYYEMVLTYVDDILHLSHNPPVTIEMLKRVFKLKDDKVAPPETYLGAQLQYKSIGGVQCWTMSSDKYVRAAIQNDEDKLK
jgi:hypothetical protein